MTDRELKAAAIHALAGVGDKSLGEWEEGPDERRTAYHLRRRLSATEQLVTGPAIDVRGTEEATRRADIVIRQCPYVPKAMILKEIQPHKCDGN